MGKCLSARSSKTSNLFICFWSFGGAMRLWTSLICIQIRCIHEWYASCWILCHKCLNLNFNLNRFLSERFLCCSTKTVIAFQPKTVHMVCFVSFMLHLNCLFVLVSIDFFFCWSFFFRSGKFYSKIMHMDVSLYEFSKRMNGQNQGRT